VRHNISSGSPREATPGHSRAHAEFFRAIRPAMTMLHVRPFRDPAMPIAIEAIAVKTNPDRGKQN
jgi:hypothetical protein